MLPMVYSYPPFQTLSWLSGLSLTRPKGKVDPGNICHLEFDVPVNTLTYSTGVFWAQQVVCIINPRRINKYFMNKVLVSATNNQISPACLCLMQYGTKLLHIFSLKILSKNKCVQFLYLFGL